MSLIFNYEAPHRQYLEADTEDLKRVSCCDTHAFDH